MWNATPFSTALPKKRNFVPALLDYRPFFLAIILYYWRHSFPDTTNVFQSCWWCNSRGIWVNWWNEKYTVFIFLGFPSFLSIWSSLKIFPGQRQPQPLIIGSHVSLASRQLHKKLMPTRHLIQFKGDSIILSCKGQLRHTLLIASSLLFFFMDPEIT